MMTAAAAPMNLRRTLDRLERAVVGSLYLFLVYRFAGAVAETPLNTIYLVTEGVVMLMVLCRRSTDQISVSPKDWSVAFAGTFLSMAILPGHPIEALQPTAGLLLLIGTGVSLLAKLQLRRSFGLVAANRGVKTTGVYGLVRHPMYLGYFFVQAGVLMLNYSSWNLVVVAAWAALQILRIDAEERVLALDAAYAEHMKRARYRLLPGLY